MAWPPMAIAKEPTGELGLLRFRSHSQSIDEVTWSDWFGEAIFQRDR